MPEAYGTVKQLIKHRVPMKKEHIPSNSKIIRIKTWSVSFPEIYLLKSQPCICLYAEIGQIHALTTLFKTSHCTALHQVFKQTHPLTFTVQESLLPFN